MRNDMRRIIMHPPMTACPRCGGTIACVEREAGRLASTMHHIRTGNPIDETSEGRSDEDVGSTIECSRCLLKLGEVVGTTTILPASDETADRTIRISTIVVFREGRMMLVRKNGLDEFILAGGKQEPGESDLDAVVRELRDETGCLPDGELRRIGVFKDAAAGSPGVEVEVTVHTGDLAGEPVPMAEIAEIRWVDPERPDVAIAPSLRNLIIPYFLAMRRRPIA